MYLPISSWFVAFALTLLVEVPVVLAMLRHQEPSLARLAVLVVFVNLATHLVVWYVATQLFQVGTIEYVLVAEAWAIGAEAGSTRQRSGTFRLHAPWSLRRPPTSRPSWSVD